MSKQRYNLKQYTELIVNKDHDGRYAKVTWINAGDLLDLLTRLEEAEKAEKQLAEKPCEDQAQEVRDFIDWGPLEGAPADVEKMKILLDHVDDRPGSWGKVIHDMMVIALTDEPDYGDLYDVFTPKAVA